MFENGWLWSGVILLLNGLIWSYLYFRRRYSYWSDQGVPGTRPLPLVGDLLQRMTSDLYQLEIDLVAKYGPLYGQYVGLTPVLVVADPTLIKQVMIKDFAHFINRFQFSAYHEMWNQNLLFSKDEQWRRIRAITTPSFSTGKLRAMHPLMSRCVDNLTAFLDKAAASGGLIDTKTVISAFAMDVIASTGFACELQSTEAFESNDKVGFLAMGRKMFNVNPVKAVAFVMLPQRVLDVFGIDQPFRRDAFNFFINLTRHIVNTRRQTGSRRNDLVQMLIDASVEDGDLMDYEKMATTEEKDKSDFAKTTKPLSQTQSRLTDSEIIANCIFFFLAGYETTGSTISHCLFALAHHPSIQERLHQKITEALEHLDNENSPEYLDTIMTQIPHLEAVIKETLRYYPPLTGHARVCNTDNYRLGCVRLKKGHLIAIPVTAMHFNPKYFPDPWTFNPDRFMPANKEIVPGTYIPFGLGPRNCVGMRFAYQEIKLCLAQILQRYQFTLAPDTPAKLTFKKGSSLLCSNNFSLLVRKRQ